MDKCVYCGHANAKPLLSALGNTVGFLCPNCFSNKANDIKYVRGLGLVVDGPIGYDMVNHDTTSDIWKKMYPDEDVGI